MLGWNVKNKGETIVSEKPKAGEWWEKEGVRLRVIGEKRNGLTVGEHECGSIDLFRSQDGWNHRPNCTGFDWVDPEPEEMVRVKLQKWVEPNGRGDFKFLRTDNEHGAGGYTRVNEWMEIEVPISKL